MRFGTNSVAELCGVHPELTICSTETLILVSNAGEDFSVFDGLRTLAEQRRNIRRGVSWTMKSYHLPQVDGMSWAVDLVPYINGRLMWDANHIENASERAKIQKRIDKTFLLIGQGMLDTAKKHGFEIEWGWQLWGKDKPHFQLRGG